MIATLTSKGQITIPKYIRDKFQLDTGSKVEFALDEGRIILKPVAGLKSLRGSIKPGSREESGWGWDHDVSRKAVARKWSGSKH